MSRTRELLNVTSFVRPQDTGWGSGGSGRYYILQPPEEESARTRLLGELGMGFFYSAPQDFVMLL